MNITYAEMTSDDFQTMVKAMAKFGGGFVRDLAALMVRADCENREALVNAFGHIVTKFGPGSEAFAQIKQMQQPKQVAA